MRRTWLLPIIVLMVLWAPSTASAHINSFEIVDVDGHLVDFSGLNWDTVSGNITCDAGERYLVVAKVIDSPSYEGKGRAKGTCTGESQLWTVQLTDESGVGDATRVSVGATAHTKSNGEPHDRVRDLHVFFPGEQG